jgi:hypothetical protein
MAPDDPERRGERQVTLSVWTDDVGDPAWLVDLGFMRVALLPWEFDQEDLEAPGWTVAEICLN